MPSSPTDHTVTFYPGEKAVQEIIQYRGVRYDPLISDIFANIIHEIQHKVQI